MVSTLINSFTFISQMKIRSIEAQIDTKKRIANRFKESFDITLQQYTTFMKKIA